MTRRTYDPGERRSKHKTPLTERPAFVVKQGALVGLCPTGLPDDVRDELLNAAVEAPATGRRTIVYNVHQGVVYMAESSNGRTFHGYPWRQRPGRPALPQLIRDALRQRAIASGCEPELNALMKEFGR